MKPFLSIPLLLAWGFALAMGTPPQSGIQAPGTASEMLRDDDLRATPEAAGKVVGRLARGAPVRLLASQGGWSQVTANGRTGWVRVLSVRAASSGQAGADLAAVAGAGSTPRDPGKVVAVAGVRGLDEAILKSAAFSPEEMGLLQRYALGRAEAEQFARAAGLQARPMPYLEAAGTGQAADLPWRGTEP